jgi:hypothetical protein
LSTIGYGPGADEASDCGRILKINNYGDIYLRSVKKTTPSLYLKTNDGNIYYGNMTAGKSSPLQITSSGTTYGVHDDSM